MLQRMHCPQTLRVLVFVQVSSSTRWRPYANIYTHSGYVYHHDNLFHCHQEASAEEGDMA